VEHTIDRETWLTIRTMTEGMEEVTLRENYAGRRMYGSTCIALVVDDGVSGLVRWTFGLTELVSLESEEVGERVGALVDAMRDTRTQSDNMGHSLVFYWPGITAEPHSA
jgi:hypothetical protein